MTIKEIVKTKNLYSPEEIDKILSQLKLKPLITPASFIEQTKGIKHRYYTRCSQNSKKYFFYALLKKEKISEEKFLRELKLTKFLRENKTDKDFPYLPSYTNISSLTNRPPWILANWINDPVLEDKKNAEVSISKLNYKGTNQLTKIIIKINNLLQTSDLQKKVAIEKFDLKQAWQKVIKNLEILKDKRINQKELKIIKQNLELDFKLWDKENRYFCHGDLHLGNIVYNRKTFNPDFKIIDWELYHINNFAYDISFLFSRLWREKKIRNNLIASYISLLPKNKIMIFQKLFKANLVYFAIIYGLKSSPLEFTKTQVKKRQAWFKKLIDLYFTNFDNYLKI